MIQLLKRISGVVLFFCLLAFTASAAEIKIIDIKPTPFFPRQESGAGLRQLVRVTLSNSSGPLGCRMAVSLSDGDTFIQELPEVTCGEGTYDVLIPDLQRQQVITFTLMAGDKVLAEQSREFKPQKKWKVYYAAVSHIDMGFETYYQYIRRGVREGGFDEALRLCRETDDWDEDSRFRWNVETSEPVIRWINKRSAAEVEELVRRINEGRIELGAIHNTISSQMAQYEVFARSFYTPNRYVADRLDIEPAKVAIINDVTGITRSWPLFSKEAGIPYLMHGSNAPNCLQDLYDLPVFYWQSTDGDTENKVLCRADSYYSANKMQKWDEADMEKLIDRNNRPDWAYDCILAYDSHDFAMPTIDNARNIKEWNSKYAYPRVVCSTLSSFFDDVASQADKAHIVENDKDAPDCWDDQDATDAELLSLARRTSSEVATAEKFSTVAMALCGGYPTEEMFQAYNGLVMYHEHTNGAIHGGNHQYYEVEKQMHRQLVEESKEFTDSVMEKTMPRLGSLIKTRGNTVVVYNPLNWLRDDIVMLDPAELPVDVANLKIYDRHLGKSLPLQKMSDGRIAFYAEDIPGMGYKSFEIMDSDNVHAVASELSEERVVDNQFYHIELDKGRNIVLGIYDKALGQEIIDTDSPYALGEYVYYDHYRKKYLKSSFTGIELYRGPVADEIHIQQEAYLAEDVELVIYVFHDVKKIDFSLRLLKLSNEESLVGSWARDLLEAMFCAIPVKVPGFVHNHELAGAVTQPGNPNMQLGSSEAAYYAIQHFADASNADMGVTLSTIDAALVEYGHPRPGLWNSSARKPMDPVVKPENSSMFLYLMNNFFSTNVCVDQPGPKRFDFSLRSHSGDWREGEAYKFAWETSNPLFACHVPANRHGVLPDTYSFVSVDSDNVVCSALKPAEFNGSGYVARFFELSGKDTEVKIRFNFLEDVTAAYSTNMIEEDEAPLLVNKKGEFIVPVSGYGISTVRVLGPRHGKYEVSGLKASAVSDSEVELVWNAEKSERISHYAIYRSADPECMVTPLNYVGTSTDGHYSDRPELNYAGWPSNSLDPSETYYYRICPVDRYNNMGKPSEAVACTTFASAEKDALPLKVQGLNAVHVSPLAPENYVTLFFYTNIEKDVDLYEIYRSDTEDFGPAPDKLVGKVVPSEKILNYKGTYTHSELERQMFNDNTAEVNKDYYYRVCAVDKSGQKGELSDAAYIRMSEIPVDISVQTVPCHNFSEVDRSVIVNITTSVPDAVIRYTDDFSVPSPDSKLYEGRFTVGNDVMLKAGVFDRDGNLLFVKSRLIKCSRYFSNSDYAEAWNAQYAFDGNDDVGSQWVSGFYGGGTRQMPEDAWVGVLLPETAAVNGVVVVGDYREIMPDFKNFEIYGKSGKELLLLGSMKGNGEFIGDRSYKVVFDGKAEVDGLMLLVRSGELPESADPGQDGLVRILELKLIMADGTVKTVKELYERTALTVDNALIAAAKTAAAN